MDFDVRSFEQYYEEDKTSAIVFNMEPFRVGFYGIGITTQGTAEKHLGKPFDSNLVLYSPYQLLSFQGVDRNWKGYYILFTQDFLSRCRFGSTFLSDFAFLRLDHVQQIKLAENELGNLLPLFKNILDEFNAGRKDKFKLIEISLELILNYIKRSTENMAFTGTDYRNKAEINLMAQYNYLIAEAFSNKTEPASEHFATSYYAARLNIHQNYLNAVSKRSTNKTAKQHIQDAVIISAKSLLIQSDLSVKQIAFQLGFDQPSHFNNFFKKNTSQTPAEYRLMNA